MSLNNSIEGKKILVVGMGKSGIAAAQALLKLGAVLSVYDAKEEERIDPQLIQYFQNKDTTCYFGGEEPVKDDFDLLVLSPGVPPELPFIERAKQQGAEVIGELEIAYRVGQGKYVAITGTNGKTTTTTLVGKIFKDAGRWTYVVGNVGVAVISKSMSAREEDWLVTETSSFQLQTIRDFKPVISALLNITPDHLDRHKTLENYAQAKARIFENQNANDYFIVNGDDEECMKQAKNCSAKVIPFSRKKELSLGCFVKADQIIIANEQGEEIPICGTNELKIPGSHNLENALAATAIAYFSGVPAAVIAESLKTFEGVEHRLEFCGEINGVRFVNDSKGTNPDASIKAIEATESKILLIAGGYDKNSNFDEFIDSFGNKVKYLLLLGKTAPKIKAAAEAKGFKNICLMKDMEECVREGFRLANPGDTVLLSPACASWDMYTCFEQRGDHFKNCVAELAK